MKKMALLLFVFVSLLSGCNSTKKEEIIPNSSVCIGSIGIGVRAEDARGDNYFQVDRVVFENNYLCLEGEFTLVHHRNFHPLTIVVRENSYSPEEVLLTLELDWEVTSKENECSILTENEYTLEGKSKLYYKIEAEKLKGLENWEFTMDCGVKFAYMGFDQTLFRFYFDEIIFK